MTLIPVPLRTNSQDIWNVRSILDPIARLPDDRVRLITVERVVDGRTFCSARIQLMAILECLRFPEAVVHDFLLAMHEQFQRECPQPSPQ